MGNEASDEEFFDMVGALGAAASASQDESLNASEQALTRDLADGLADQLKRDHGA